MATDGDEADIVAHSDVMWGGGLADSGDSVVEGMVRRTLVAQVEGMVCRTLVEGIVRRTLVTGEAGVCR